MADDHRWASMRRVGRVVGHAVSGLAVAALLVHAWLITPDEAMMGGAVRILYVHVGVAWTAYLAFAVTAVGAVVYLGTRAKKMDRLAVASAEWGGVLTTATLVSGSLWARATQGWWWRWDDARLTLTLMMWFIYAAYLVLRQYADDRRRPPLSAIVALAGVPAMVLNHLATRIFPAFHPPPVAARSGGPALDAAFVQGLALSLLAFTLVYVEVLILRVRLEERRDALKRLQESPGPGSG